LVALWSVIKSDDSFACHSHARGVAGNEYLSCAIPHSFGKWSVQRMGRMRSARKWSPFPAKSECNYHLAWCGNAGNGSRAHFGSYGTNLREASRHSCSAAVSAGASYGSGQTVTRGFPQTINARKEQGAV
jgi:hypothetical protein